jgi:hypothetical protein
VAAAIVALLAGALMLPNQQVFARDCGGAGFEKAIFSLSRDGMKS